MSCFQKAFAAIAALILSLAFVHAGEKKDVPKEAVGDLRGPKNIEGGSSGTSTGGSTGSSPGPSAPHAPKKNSVSTVRPQSMQKLTPNKAEAGSENIRRSNKH
jgi:hypothetical protein